MDDAGEMSIKADAPPISRPPSPEREKRFLNALAVIPEAKPGPNAFAQQAARTDRYRLDGNAFYQQEMQKRRATPPTTLHPALRATSSSDPPSPLRGSMSTTMSPFINTGRDQREAAPPIKLTSTDANRAVPTLRGHIEERQEQFTSALGGTSPQRVPIHVSTSKIAATDFADETTSPRKRVDRNSTHAEPPPKTPKKGFFGRLKLATNLRGTSSPSVTSPDTIEKQDHIESIPVKAQAVLGTSPSKATRISLGSSASRTNLPRSPSKRKGFFSRKNSLVDVQDTMTSSTLHSADTEQPPLTAVSLTKTPQTALSDPTHYSYHNRRNVSQAQSDHALEKASRVDYRPITRTQSLKYFDHTVPPTPPAKNTPPEERVKKEAALLKGCALMPPNGQHDTPSQEPTAMLSINRRISPTRFGGYGNKVSPQLVTKPSVYSLRASVVPDMMGAGTFEEVKARIDGLGLEGFNMPSENQRASSLSQPYTPSMYTNDWNDRPNTVLVRSSLPAVHSIQSPNVPSTHTKESSSSNGTIPVIYPELAHDPSRTKLHTLREVLGQKRTQSDVHLDFQRPWHGCTHSIDHSTTSSPRPSMDSSIFARHVEDAAHEVKFGSPASFAHPSATPSPLHLPSTVFTPPPRGTSKLHHSRVKQVNIGEGSSSTSKGATTQSAPSRTSSSPCKTRDVFKNAPSFSPRSSNVTSHTRSSSPQDSGIENSSTGSSRNVDPQKPLPQEPQSDDKLDQMIQMLNRLNARNTEISYMRDEMRATNERLDQRLAAVEDLQRGTSPVPSYAVDEDVRYEKAGEGLDCNRIPTDVAHDFYRAEEARNGGRVQTDEVDRMQSDTIAELKETNRRLLEMVGGFAEKIQALENRGSGRF